MQFGVSLVVSARVDDGLLGMMLMCGVVVFVFVVVVSEALSFPRLCRFRGFVVVVVVVVGFRGAVLFYR